MYDAAGAWGGTNPFPGTLIVLTHRTEDQPDPSAGFLFIDGFDAALLKARELAGDGGVSLGGGANLIRQGLAAGVVDELAISTAPLVLGGGKRLFDGFEQDLDLEVLAPGARSTPPTCGTPSSAPGRSTRALTTARLRHDASPKEDLHSGVPSLSFFGELLCCHSYTPGSQSLPNVANGPMRASSARQGATTKELMRHLGHATADIAMRYQRAETNRDRALAKAMSDDVLNRRTSDA